ncbi:MAG: hypothetical protein HYS12_21725 [Planctomycetes bacterium]|nr:hypothetical protein [Planctomycetota bacterium]
MTRKSFLRAVGIVLVLTGGTCATLILLIRHEPEAYRRACLPPGRERALRSQEFYSGFLELYNACTNKDRDLDLCLTDEQINSYFVEDFQRSGVARRLLPEKISEPRVLLEPGKVRLAFRYGSGLWSTIITIDFGLWLCPEESNVIALELQGLHAGSLPIGAQAFLDSLSEIAEQNNIQVSWHRYPPTGNPVALLRFQSDSRDMTLQLQAVHVEQGNIVIRGRPVDSESSQSASLPSNKPAGN